MRILLLFWFGSTGFAGGCPIIAQWPETDLLNLMVCTTEPFFPETGGNWETVDPELLGWDVDLVPGLFDYLETNHSQAFLVLYRGRIALEQYWGLNLSEEPFDQESYWYWASAGKTLTAVLVGMAQNQGFLSLEDSSSDYLGTGWTSLDPIDEEKILIRHQLTMTSGLDEAVGDFSCTLPECLVYKADPGNRWAYHNGPYTMLDGVIESAVGQDFSVFFNENLRNPIGMQGFWAPSGYNNVFYSRPRDMARYGILIQNYGVWAGEIVIEDFDYLMSMVSPSQDLNPSYGYLWWLNGQSSFMIPGLQVNIPGPMTPNAPNDMFSALGKNGQMLNIVPSMDLIVIRMGDSPDQSPVAAIFLDEMWALISAILQ